MSNAKRIPPSQAQRDFERWYAKPLSQIAKTRNNGLIVVLITFPLLERYLVRRSGGSPSTAQFSTALLQLVPILQTSTKAAEFWKSYRHGMVHAVALPTTTHRLSHDALKDVEIDANGQVVLNPVRFLKLVLRTVRADFPTFEQGEPLPVELPVNIPSRPGAPGAPIYMGTGSR